MDYASRKTRNHLPVNMQRLRYRHWRKRIEWSAVGTRRKLHHVTEIKILVVSFRQAAGNVVGRRLRAETLCDPDPGLRRLQLMTVIKAIGHLLCSVGRDGCMDQPQGVNSNAVSVGAPHRQARLSVQLHCSAWH